MTTTQEINQIVNDRELNQWHLLIASLLGSLGQRGNNQGSLNLLMAHSMDDFIIPYLAGQSDVDAVKADIALADTLTAQMEIAVKQVNDLFNLAGSITCETSDNPNEVVVKIETKGCRYCPVGVGRAQIDPNTTFCPIPTMLEKSLNYFRGDQAPVKLQLHREKASTRVLIKKDGHCFISYKS